MIHLFKRGRIRFHLSIFGLCLLSMMVGCTPTSSTSTNNNRVSATANAPTWQNSTIPITTENAPNIQLLGRLDSPAPASTIFQFDATDSHIAALNNDALLIFDLATGLLQAQNARGDFTSVHYSADETRLYALDIMGELSLLNAEDARQIETFRAHSDFSGAFAVNSMQDLIVFGGEDGTVSIWNGAERRAVSAFEVHANKVTAVALSGDGAWLASADAETVRLWDWRAQTLIGEIGVPSVPHHLQFSVDAQQIAIGMVDQLAVWVNPADENASLQSLRTGLSNVSVLTYSPDGQFLMGGNASQGVTVWELNTTNAWTLQNVRGSVVAGSFSPHHPLIATSVMGSGVQLWNLSHVEDENIPQASLSSADTRIFQVQWSPDGRFLFMTSAAGAIYAWGIGS